MDPLSQSCPESGSSLWLPRQLPSTENKIQTSSNWLRMTKDGRPFTKDFEDIFSALIISLLPFRCRLRGDKISFSSKVVLNNLGGLTLSKSNCMSPKDVSRIVKITTTTTITMAKDMAQSICEQFLEACYIETANDGHKQLQTMESAMWQLTPKGINILRCFCSRNNIRQKQVAEIIDSEPTLLVVLERDSQTDQLAKDYRTIEDIFRLFVNCHGPYVNANVNSAAPNLPIDYPDSLTDLNLTKKQKAWGKQDSFAGTVINAWLIHCTTTVNQREAYEIANLFVEYDLMDLLWQDQNIVEKYPCHKLSRFSEYTSYHISTKLRDLINCTVSRGHASQPDQGVRGLTRSTIARDFSHSPNKILNDATLQSLFRQYLRETHCEENLAFYLDASNLVCDFRRVICTAQRDAIAISAGTAEETMALAYTIYDTFIAPGSPCELNIDYHLRQNLITYMSKAVDQGISIIDMLQEITTLFEEVQNAVFELMTSDSIPKFLQSPKYKQILKKFNGENGEQGTGLSLCCRRDLD